MEVPFFPRRFGRRPAKRPRWREWLSVGLVVTAALVGPAIAWRWWRWTVHAGRADALRHAMAEIDALERDGDPSAAFLAAEEARSLAIRSGEEPPGGLARLTSRRDALARRDVEERLEALSSLPPDRAFEEAKILDARVATDPALSSLSSRSSAAATTAAGRWVDHHLACAERSIDAGRSSEAMAISCRVSAGLDSLPASRGSSLRGRVREFSGALVERIGVRIGPIALASAPRFDGAPSYEDDLVPPIAGALADRGYLPMAPDSMLADLWARAPFRLRATVDERPGIRYLQSPNRTTRIGVDLALDREGQPIWNEHLESRTRVPLPGLSAMEASRVALGHTPDPQVERRLYRDSRVNLLEKLRVKLTSLPPAPVGE